MSRRKNYINTLLIKKQPFTTNLVIILHIIRHEGFYSPTPQPSYKNNFPRRSSIYSKNNSHYETVGSHHQEAYRQETTAKIFLDNSNLKGNYKYK